MAASHMAIVRSSARMAHDASELQDNEASEEKNLNPGNIELSNDLSQLSVISVGNSEDDDLSQEMSLRRSTANQSDSNTSRRHANRIPKLLTAPLERLNSSADIETNVEPELSQYNVLCRLEQKWTDISNNLDSVVCHLQECSSQVVDASTNCLESLKDSIDTTCDKIDGEMNALSKLIAKCDDLTTKLSVAGSFREEIKTLKKSVETLENLYKSRKQLDLSATTGQPPAPPPPATTISRTNQQES